MLNTYLTNTVALALVAGLAGSCTDEAVLGPKAAHNDGSASAAGSVTWHADIAPIVIGQCSACHREGGIGPFSLTSYEAAKPYASALASAVEEGRMPPFLADDTDECQPRLPWSDDLRLSSEDKAKLRAWADEGAPEGDHTGAAHLPRPPNVELAREDVVMRIPEEILIDGKQDIHTCIVVDPKLTQDRYVFGRQISAGNAKVLHHVVSYILEPGQNPDGTERSKAQLEAALREEKGVGVGGSYECFGGPTLMGLGVELLHAWAPGGTPTTAPADSGQRLDKDALVIMDVHYHPTGHGPERDLDTRLALMLTDSKPSYVSRTVLIGNFDGLYDSEFGIGELLRQPDEGSAQFLIPAGKVDHVEEMTWTWKLAPHETIRVYGAGSHMHYVGRDLKLSLERAAPRAEQAEQECLLQTPRWNFNWQRGYGYDADYAELPTLRNGDVLRIRCTFDNSMGNPFVRDALKHEGLDAPVDIPLGEDTLNEMCLVGIGITYLNLSKD